MPAIAIAAAHEPPWWMIASALGLRNGCFEAVVVGEPLRTSIWILSSSGLDVVGVDVGPAPGGWLGAVHGDRECFLGVHGDLGWVLVAVSDAVGVVGW
jgi:hypothetical protein